MRPLVLLALLALTSLPAWAQVDERLPGLGEVTGPAQWRTEARLQWSSPLGLPTGMPFGGGLSVLGRVGESAWYLGARVAFTRSQEANADWTLDHRHWMLAPVARVQRRAGVAMLFAEAGAGLLALQGIALRQQAQRLEGLGLTDLERRGVSWGPWVWAELGIALEVRQGISALISVGPVFAPTTTQSTELSRVWGVQSTLGVSGAL